MNGTAPHERIFCAVDMDDLAGALVLCHALEGHVGGIKLGLEFFSALGRKGVRAVAQTGTPVFLDLKLHDIPNTVAGAVRSLTPLGPVFMTVHAQGGRAMMEAAVRTATDAAAEAQIQRPALLGVTVLTSLDGDDLGDIGVISKPVDQVLRLAELARESGLDGVVCSPWEIRPLRDRLGDGFLLVVPGIRPEGAARGDQKRIMTPTEALDAGASHLVIGRPITAAADPRAAATAISASLRHKG